MAGAGRKTFIPGEVLTATDVNQYLMDQAVMRFADAAARSASIGVPTEGMVTYLDDENRLEYYDGSSWINVVPQDQIDGKIAASLFTASAQVLVGAGAASVIAVGGGGEGQVLTTASAQPGGLTWATPAGAGAAIFKLIAATGTTALPAELTPGFYRINYGTVSLNQTQLRFVDTFGNFYGASIASGNGFVTIPTTVASVNLTTSAGNNLLVEELPGVTATLPNGPTVTDFDWDSTTGGSISFTTSGSPTRVGYYNPLTGSLVTSSVVTSPFYPAVLSSSATAFGSDVRFVFMQQGGDGTWSTSASLWSASALDTPYPFQFFTSNGTYTTPVWSTSADVLIVSGGGAGGGGTSVSGQRLTGGGGGGGASVWTGYATSGSYAVVVGAGGAGVQDTGTQGSSSSFGALSTTGGGGGGGGAPGPTAGGAGGSGGGGSYRAGFANALGGTGISGQGFDGGASGLGFGGGGGGAGEVGNADGQCYGGDGAVFFGYTMAGGGGAFAVFNPIRPAGDGLTGGGGNGARIANTAVATGTPGTAGIVIVKAKA
jgi:hypothetical protein